MNSPIAAPLCLAFSFGPAAITTPLLLSTASYCKQLASDLCHVGSKSESDLVTTRKPARMSFPDWVEQQIRAAEHEGAFDNLPGKGKPIPGLGAPRDDMAWIANKLRA